METFQTFADQYGYLALFVGVLLENAGLPVPGETAVLVSGFLASPAGGGHFHIEWVILLTFLAAVLGDNVGFWLGHRWARPRLQQGRGFLFLTPKTLQVAEGYFTRYGVWTIFFARFITGLRVVGALAAGTAGMAWTRFLVANAAGALAWALTMSLLGYFCGHSWELLHKWLGRGGLILVGCVLVLVGIPYLRRHWHRLSPAAWSRRTAAPATAEPGKAVPGAARQVALGLLAAVLEVICIALLVRLDQGERATRLDRTLADWIDTERTPTLDLLAAVGSLPGTFPLAVAVTLVMIAWLWFRKRSWRERAVILWALVASEGIGLVLLGLFHSRDIQPVRGVVWPFGFAGLVPLRAFAVLGMSAQVVARQSRRGGRIARGLAALLILLVGGSVVWTGEQLLTETLLEFAAAAVIVFAGLWWLEGDGPGFLPGQREPVPESEPERLPAVGQR